MTGFTTVLRYEISKDTFGLSQLIPMRTYSLKTLQKVIETQSKSLGEKAGQHCVEPTGGVREPLGSAFGRFVMTFTRYQHTCPSFARQLGHVGADRSRIAGISSHSSSLLGQRRRDCATKIRDVNVLLRNGDSFVDMRKQLARVN